MKEETKKLQNNNTYKINYNNFGICFVAGNSFEEAENKFRTYFNKEDFEIKSIEYMPFTSVIQ